jgi:nitrogen fixation protein NifU and related proteins
MTAELSDLYQEVILDHNKRPRNFGHPAEANRHAEGYNPLCGDKVTVHLELAGGVLRSVAFEGSGCAISKASASMMTEALRGKSEAEAEALFERFHRLVTGESAPGEEAALGKLIVFSGVRGFPMRVKCASLAWHTLNAALHDRHETTSTE